MQAAALGFIAEAGQLVTFRRVTNAVSADGGSVTATNRDVKAKALVLNYKAREIVGLVQQGDIKIVVAGAALAAFPGAEPSNQDKVILGNGKILTVQSVNSSGLSGLDIVFTLQVRG